MVSRMSQISESPRRHHVSRQGHHVLRQESKPAEATGSGVFDIRNAASATIRGVEVEHTSRSGRGFRAGGHVTWLDATYFRDRMAS